MKCDEVRDLILHKAFQQLSRAELEVVEEHFDSPCRACVASFRGALALRQASDRIEAGSDESGRSRIEWGVFWVRVVSILIVLFVVTLVIEQTVKVAQYAYEKKFIQRVEKAVFLYRIDHGTFPPSAESLSRSLADGPSGPYLDLREERVDSRGEFLDRWKNVYHYRFPGVHNPRLFDLWSAGRNRREEEGGGDDVNNWSEYQFSKIRQPRWFDKP